MTILATALANGVTSTLVSMEGGTYFISCSAPGGGFSGAASVIWTDEQGTDIILTTLSPNGSNPAKDTGHMIPAGEIKVSYSGTGVVNVCATRLNLE